MLIPPRPTLAASSRARAMIRLLVASPFDSPREDGAERSEEGATCQKLVRVFVSARPPTGGNSGKKIAPRACDGSRPAESRAAAVRGGARQPPESAKTPPP